MMQPLSAAALLAVWEENWRQPPLRQGLALLAAACPEEHQETLLALSMGSFNAHLLTLHAWSFGPSLTTVTTCTGCGEVVEATLDAASLHARHSDPPSPWLEVADDAGAVRVRPPTLGDLIAAGDATTLDAAAQSILARCLETPSRPLPPATLAAVTDAMEHADPLAVIELGGACPHCERAWSAFLDVASFIWREVQTWAQRTLQEIHLLARAYGWREVDILALTPVRRQAYLQMVYG
jgi:hypothetical protein